jgi:ribonucleotide reductase alpha subunit
MNFKIYMYSIHFIIKGITYYKLEKNKEKIKQTILE